MNIDEYLRFILGMITIAISQLTIGLEKYEKDLLSKDAAHIRSIDIRNDLRYQIELYVSKVIVDVTQAILALACRLQSDMLEGHSNGITFTSNQEIVV